MINLFFSLNKPEGSNMFISDKNSGERVCVGMVTPKVCIRIPEGCMCSWEKFPSFLLSQIIIHSTYIFCRFVFYLVPLSPSSLRTRSLGHRDSHVTAQCPISMQWLIWRWAHVICLSFHTSLGQVTATYSYTSYRISFFPGILLKASS